MNALYVNYIYKTYNIIMFVIMPTNYKETEKYITILFRLFK